jgi:formate/nitrite transporter FocA (FNT family)
MPASVDELVVKIADVCAYKWDMLKNRPFAFFLSAFAGGAFVSFGAMLALSVSAGVPESMAVGFANLLMGLVFTFSLVIIMFSGMTLVTADMGYGIIGVFHKRITYRQHVFYVVIK